MPDVSTPSRIFNGTAIPLPGVYTLDPVHTFAEFVTQNLVVGHVGGRFDRVTGKATVADDPALTSLEVTIETASVNTHNATRDEDLRSPRFFAVEEFPTITYRGSKIVVEPEGRWTVAGELTIRDVTVPVPVAMRITGIITDPMGKVRVGLHAHAQISRRDFGLLADIEREGGGVVIGKDIAFTVYAEALHQE